MPIASISETIRSELESRILSGALSPGARIPVERELMEEYGCSRMTVNKAISSLVAAGLIERRKKAGSFVSRPIMHPTMLAIPDVQTDAVAKGQYYSFRLLRREVRTARKRNGIEAALGQNGQLLALSGIHIVDHQPLVTEERIISLASVPEIEDVDFTKVSPGTWLLQHIPWTQSETRLSSTAASMTEAPLLDIPFGAACFVVERKTWRETLPITYVRQVYNGSAFSLTGHFGVGSSR
ncbi:UTRA domain-containing protein [Silvibacterium dinghuense]|uniref:UTRA domain-containing protein n=1 Tax=Silvibacterium dinghuense TaxID=1560006 RepID=A0A4Q1SCT7_9BACT|nr:UTRA domain-containing protein [Silvibacterium dinghuense]RXS94875.1 UTRA domain-containing protein [Silvibacterium dinghuense]GGH08659.1 histidine utilization repressor [Silvibacterium dinghuense]